MEHFIRIAVWITLLTLSGCLQTQSLPIKDFGADYMRENVTCPSDSKFYTPGTITDQCITTALDCVRKELNVPVRSECEDPAERIDDAVEYLDRFIESLGNKHALTNSTECECERWPETSFSKFLTETVSLLQRIKTSDQ